jgi:tRNA 2-thiocytidine biosynthesis protein TtcA
MSPLEKSLLSALARASHDYRLIENGDRIMVAVSGGKDSLCLLHLLRQIQRRAPFDFEIVAVTLDQGQPGFAAQTLAEHYAGEGFEYRIVREDTYAIVQEKLRPGDTACSLCSRLRRGVLYNVAAEFDATKIALGHHRDDLLETLLLNLLYSGQIKAMAPRLRSDDGRNLVIRPLVYCDEHDLAALATELQLPVVSCGVCATQQNLRRVRVKRLIQELHADNDNVRGSLFAALGTVRATHLLDRDLMQRLGLEPWA